MEKSFQVYVVMENLLMTIPASQVGEVDGG